MGIERCYGRDCDKVYCFVECNNMELNISCLEEISRIIDRYIDFVDVDDTETFDLIYNLQKDFQEKFMELCDDFRKNYMGIIENVCQNTSKKED
jgi:hypothetical protein